MQINRANFAELFRADFVLANVYFIQSEAMNEGRDKKAPLKSYTYKVPKDWDVKIGDRLVVNTSADPSELYELPVVRVISVNVEPEIEGPKSINYKWAVDKLDNILAGYNKNLEKDYKLKKAFSTLEKKLEQMTLRKMLNELMGELPQVDRDELKELFGTDLLDQNQISNGANSGDNVPT